MRNLKNNSLEHSFEEKIHFMKSSITKSVIKENDSEVKKLKTKFNTHLMNINSKELKIGE